MGGLSRERIHAWLDSANSRHDKSCQRRFGDQTYIYTEWADVQAETIYDKGSWRVSGGVVHLASGSEIAWNPECDRRYVSLKQPHEKAGLLFGIDATLPRFRELADQNKELGEGDAWLRALSFQRKEGLPPRQGERLKTRLLRASWMPSYFNTRQ